MRQKQISAIELSMFCQELYQLVQAGLPIAEGLGMLLADEKDAGVRAWLGPLCEHAEEGLPLAECMRRTGAFPAYMTDMIALAEQTGRLQDVLPALSAHYARQDRMASDIRHAVAVPVALFCVMLAVVFLLITQVLPVFDRVFAQLGVRMSPMAVRLMQVGDVLSGAGLGIAIALCALAVVALAVALIPALRGRFIAFVRFHLGGRGIFGRVAATRFASAMAMATASGLMMDEAAELAGKLCGGAKQIDEKTRLCAEKIAEGGSTAQALADSGLFSARDGRLLQLAERTGSLAETLDGIAARLEQDTMRRIDARISAIEPAIVILTALLAGVILLSVMLPLMSIMSTIG